MKLFRKGQRGSTAAEKEAWEKATNNADDFGGVRKPDKGELAKLLSGSLAKGGPSFPKVPPKSVRSSTVKGSAKQEMAAASKLSAPNINRGSDDALRQKIYEHAASERSPQYPEATSPVFGPADAEKTKAMVPQTSIAHRLPPVPPGDKLPAKGRSSIILNNNEAIAQRLVQNLRNSPHADNPLPFYSTGSVLEGLQDKGGLTPDQSMVFMRDWAGQGAGTSPRTATPQNMRNASFLMDLRHQGDALTPERQKQQQEQALFGFPPGHNRPGKSGEPPQANLNRPGFAMMGMHTDLANKFANDSVDPWNNPKPYTFRENWSGNMADVTADTHNIRAVLDAYDSLDPGGIPREWFKSEEGFRRYVEGGGFPKEGQIDVGAIEDGLKGQQINGRFAQTEYPVIQGPTKRAAEIMGISPAEAQERLWFDMGSRTGLQSPRQAIPDLLNSQIEATARATGLDPEVILRLWAQRRIPLAANEQDMAMPGASASA